MKIESLLQICIAGSLALAMLITCALAQFTPERITTLTYEHGAHMRLDAEQLDESLDAITLYIQDEFDEQRLAEVIGEAEAAHLHDVRDVLATARTIIITLVLIALIFAALITANNGAHTLIVLPRSIGIATLICSAGAGLLALAFELSFSLFHTLAFPQGNYTFAAESVLIRLFPLPLFAEGFGTAIAFVALIGAALFASGDLLYTATRPHDSPRRRRRPR